MNYKEEHISLDYFTKITTIKQIQGLIARFPKNIFLSCEEMTLIYEIAGPILNIYMDGMKMESIKCPEYALRFLVATDVSLVMRRRGMDTSLIRAFDSDGVCISNDDNKVSLSELISPFKSRVIKRKEMAFSDVLNKYTECGNEEHIGDDLIEGFKILEERYIGE